MIPLLAHAWNLVKVAVPAGFGFAVAHPELIPTKYAAIAGAVIAAYTAVQTQAQRETARGVPGWASQFISGISIRFRFWFPRGGNGQPARAGRKVAVIIGLTRVDPERYDGWDGACPGCDVDARRLRSFYEARGVEVPAFLLNEAATIANVEAAILAAGRGLNPDTDLLIIENSSHGGRERDLNGDEIDGMDETICLYDGQWLDDRVARLLAKLPARLRVLFGSDSCHSGSNTRSASAATRARFRFPRRIRRSIGVVSAAVRVVHFAGCSDAKFSYGSASGGQWTLARLDAFRPGMTYREWFDAAAKRMPNNQVPLLTLDPAIGSFADEPALS